MKTGILYFTTCFHGFGILRHVDPFVKMLHICVLYIYIHKSQLWLFIGTMFGLVQLFGIMFRLVQYIV